MSKRITNDDRLQFLASMYEFHVKGGFEYGDPTTIDRVEGPINDREYVEIGKGDDFIHALDNAIIAARNRAGEEGR